jgi:hypothetical protein
VQKVWDGGKKAFFSNVFRAVMLVGRIFYVTLIVGFWRASW